MPDHLTAQGNARRYHRRRKRTREDRDHCEKVMTPRFQFQDQVEYDLGRPLTDAELQEVPSLDQLTDDQIAVADVLRQRNELLPMLYIKAIVPTASHTEVRRFIHDDIERIAIERRPPPDLPNQDWFEHYAGRPLRPMELVRVESFEKVSSEQIDLARTLAAASPPTCFLYLKRIVPGESIERIHELTKHIEESVTPRSPYIVVGHPPRVELRPGYEPAPGERDKSRSQLEVEAKLGRPLTDAELQEVASLDQLTDDQLAVVAALRQQILAAAKYVSMVVPTLTGYKEVFTFIDAKFPLTPVE